MIKKTGYAILLIVLTGFAPLQEEKYPFSKWDDKTIEKARTYTDNDKIGALEKEVIFYTNLCRINPKLFADTYVQQYLDDNELKSSYTGSLIRDLKKAPKLDVLKFDKDLYYCARAHAESNGKKGLEGHQNFNSRFKKYAPGYRTRGENCDYGSNNALEVVMDLLIDEDVPDTGHRKNILLKDYKYLGTAYAPHKQYAHSVVMCFGG